MGVFSSGGVGLDLGSANVTICLENEGIVLREPSYVLTLRDDRNEVLAVGRDARQMLGRTPKDVALLSPVADGAVADVELSTLLMTTLSEKALGRRRPLERNRLVVSASLGATRVEQNALSAAVHAAGAKRAYTLRSAVAAATGAGIPFAEPKGVMIVLIGGSTTEVAVLSMNGIAAARTMRTGSLAFDEAIIRHIRREKGLIIGQRTAEDLKIDLGSAKDIGFVENEEVSLRGRDARSGKPATVSVTARDIHNAIMPCVDMMVENIREAFENTPEELASDILERGIYLSGGGALLDGLNKKLGDTLGIAVTVSATPQDDVARGLCMTASDDRLAQNLMQTGCMNEV